jgi:hypothetical protein
MFGVTADKVAARTHKGDFVRHTTHLVPRKLPVVSDEPAMTRGLECQDEEVPHRSARGGRQNGGPDQMANLCGPSG